MSDVLLPILPLLIGWLLDLVWGDPAWLPHPVVGFGKMIAFGEHRLNKGHHRKLKGAVMSLLLIVIVFAGVWLLRAAVCVPPSSCRIPSLNSPYGLVVVDAILIFYCLAGTTLIREVQQVFWAVDCSLDEGRRQVARIVGRDTSHLDAQEIRTAALETLAENLSDGVIAPLFWWAVAGVPGMMAYKMVNTLDSMIGYRTARYKAFGCWAARIDDVANFIPARLTALLMIVGYWLLAISYWPRVKSQKLIAFVRRYGRMHASPNSGYPEAALAGILDCRFGGPHYYFGELFDKPYIGENPRPLTTADMRQAVGINRAAEVIAIILILAIYGLTIYPLL